MVQSKNLLFGEELSPRSWFDRVDKYFCIIHEEINLRSFQKDKLLAKLRPFTDDKTDAKKNENCFWKGRKH